MSDRTLKQVMSRRDRPAGEAPPSAPAGARASAAGATRESGESLWDEKANAAELLELLSRIVARHGAAPLLAAPLIEESPRCFPDPWEPSLVGVAQILHRLLRYAGLDGWRLELVDGRAPLAEPLKLAQPRIGFIAAEGDRLSFQLEEMGTPEWVPAALCFEVGRAFVATRESRHPYRATEDDATAASSAALIEAAVATIYLGLGLITTNAAHGFAQEGEIVGQIAVTRRAHLELGALPAGDLTFLLAVQLTLRGLSVDEAAPLLQEMAQSQSDDVRAWLKRLVDAGPALRARLGIAATDRPPPIPLPEVGPLPARMLEELEAAEELHLRPHSAVRVTRYWERKTVPGLFIGLFASMVPMIPVALAGWIGPALALLPAGIEQAGCTDVVDLPR